MAIRVSAVGDQFAVEVTAPHGDWRSNALMSPTEVLERLGALGCHSTDATDALDASGAHWRPVHDAEVLRRRHG